MKRPIFIRESDDLLTALAQEREARGMTCEELDHKLGVTRGHSNKMENGTKPWGRLCFRMTAIVGWALEYYGLRLVLMPADMAESLMLEADVRSNRRPYFPRGGGKAPDTVTEMAVITSWLQPK